MRATRYLALLLFLLLLGPLLLIPVASTARPTPSGAGFARPFSTARPLPRRLGAVAPPVRLVSHSDTISVHGLPRYFGIIELTSASDGLAVSNRLSLERYLWGLNEVPTSWPREALRAQAVAARTYALWTLAGPREGLAAAYGFDICATVQCQVFSGADVVLGGGGAWAEAVQSTNGLAVLYEGQPILARYHSTSGGTTLDNPQAFPDEPAYPYLQGVSSTTETASPLYRWRTRFRVDRLTKILQHAGWWTHGRVTRAYTRPSRSGKHYPDVVVKGRKGPREGGVEGTHVGTGFTAEKFRSVLRDFAPQLYPGLYPGAWHTTSGRLPETLPSNRITVTTEGKFVVVEGRGWGHGVGMSQWGAFGLAQQGASFDQILTHYYTGVSIDQVETSTPIEVGVAFGKPSVTVTGAFEIVDGNGNTIVKNAVGTWVFKDEGGAVAVDPPRGFGLPLKVGIVWAPKRTQVGKPTFLSVALSRPAEVRAETVGMKERFPKTRVKSAGKRRVTWLAPVRPGRYRVRVRVSIGDTTRYSDPVPIIVEDAAAIPEVQPTPVPIDEQPLWMYTIIGAGVALLAVVCVSILIATRSRGPTPEDRQPF